MILSLLLVLSIAGNVVLWFWGSSAQDAAQMYVQTLEAIGSSEGREEAEKDFAAGTPRWYQFPGDRGGEMPKDKSGRTLAVFELWPVPQRYHFRVRAFISGYNNRTDELFARKTRAPERKG